MVSEDLFIDALDMSKNTRGKIQNVILQLGQTYPEFGERIPVQYKTLQEKIGQMRKDEKRVIPYTLLEKANAELDTPLSAEELHIFLQFQHNCGFLLFYNDIHLKDYVVLDAKLVIDATKCIVTSEQFITDTWDKETWTKKVSTGEIEESYILKIWKGKSKELLYEHRKFLLQLLQRLDIIAKPKIYEEGIDVPVTFYYVPCMLQTKVQDTETKVKDEDIKLTFKFKDLLPPAVVHKIFASCLALWPVEKNCLYEGWALFASGPNHLILLRRDSRSIVVSIQCRQNAAEIDIQLALSIKHFLVQTIHRIVSVYSAKLQKESGAIYSIEYNQTAASVGIDITRNRVRYRQMFYRV